MADPASYTKGDWTNLVPAATKAKMDNIENGIKANNDALVAETDAGRAITQAADAAAQRSALGLGDSATKNVGTGAGDVAAGNAPADAVTTHESTYEHGNIPTADEKTRLGDIQAATGATTALKLANLTSPATPTQQGVALLGASGGATKLTKMPDGATAVASQATRSTTTGWNPNSGGSLSVVDGKIRATWIGSNNNGMIYDLGGYGQDVLFRTRASRSLNASLYNGYIKISYVNLTTSWQVLRYKNPIRSSGFYAGIFQAPADCQSGDWIEIDWIWIGDYSYLTGSLSEEAARIANQRGDVAASGVYASQTITASTTTLPTAGKSDTIGGKKYTFVAALTASPGVEGEVLIDASGGDDATKCKNTLENLNLALSEAARTNNGTLYWAAAVHPLVSSARVNEVLTLTAKTNNGPENDITVVCEAGTNHTAGGATLLGGYTDSAAKTKAENNAALGYTPAATPNKTATTSIGYFAVADCASGAQVTLPAGGTWAWEVTTYGATYNSVKSGTAAGGAAISGTASANLCMRYERVI